MRRTMAARLTIWASVVALGWGTVAVPRTVTAQDTTWPSGRPLPADVSTALERALAAPNVRRWTGAFTVAATDQIDGGLAVFTGPLTIAGRVKGTVIAVHAPVVLLRGAVIEGDVLVVGGSIVGRDSAEIRGEVRMYRETEGEDRDVARFAPRGPTTDRDDDAWIATWRRREENSSGLRLTTAKTFNRVEGLPIVFGPTMRRDVGVGRLAVDLFGIFRTSQGIEWNAQTVGYRMRAELRRGERSGIAVGGRLYDVVEAVEPWTLQDDEAGLAAFFFKRDFRDFFGRHGGTAFVRAFGMNGATDLTISHGFERWGSRRAYDVGTVFRRSTSWRVNPLMDDVRLHTTNATWRMDTRNNPDDPSSGWFVTADYEYGRGVTNALANTSPGVRDGATPGRLQYGRGMVDVRRYNRLAADAELNLRFFAAGWLHGDELPLQRRLSMSGPGAIPGFAFRDPGAAPDVGECSASPLAVPAIVGSMPQPSVAGAPAQCERVALVQVEYRGALHLDFFDVLGFSAGTRPVGVAGSSQRGWTSRAHGTWVLFADAGRGWLVGPRSADLRFQGSSSWPAWSTLRTDIGVGIDFQPVGLYIAKSLSEPSRSPVFFARVNKRF